MAQIIRSSINLIFYYICLIFAFVLALWCISVYVKNYDITEITFHSFTSQTKSYDVQYPSMTLCIADSYKEFELRKYSDSLINSTSYSKFLLGEHWNKDMLSLAYDRVTIDIRDYIIGECILSAKLAEECHKFGPIRHFTRLTRLGIQKCFSFDLAIKDTIDEAFIAINNSIHPNGLRPEFGRFLVMFHYPHQITRSIANSFRAWPLRSNAMDDYYSMMFYISNIEIWKRRKNGREQCHDWKDYDISFIEDVMKSVGCRPPYWKSRHDHPACNLQTQLSDTKVQFNVKMLQDETFQKYIPPCIEITKMDVRYEETSGEMAKVALPYVLKHFESVAGTRKGWFVINSHFWQAASFKQMRNVKAYSLQSMIGNSGGYIGLLVGITISDLPRFLGKLYLAIKGIFQT